jgi:DNA-directed RNA polymerase specialized sigma24 family protein
MSPPGKAAIDWHALHHRALERVRRTLKPAPRTLDDETLEDLAREAMVMLFRLSRREALADPGTLLSTLVDRVCVDHVRRSRGPAARLEPVDEKAAPGDGAGATGVDMLELFRFVVLEHLKQHDASCQELAEEFFTELSWTAVARRAQLRHSTVIRRWSRCSEQIRELAYAQRGPLWEWARAARIV